MEKTNLNISPYYDDFDESDNFNRVLFRPSFAIQARELTTLQTILQNQIDRFGRHMFKEGSMVIPGNIGFTNEFFAVKLQSTFSSSSIANDIQDYVGTRITGASSGVVAEVIQAEAATSTDPITLFVKYIKTGTNNTSATFTNGENISSDGVIGSFSADAASATLQSSDATATGSSASIEQGVYFIRGHFVRVATQRIILDKYTDTPSYRIGLTLTETLVTPESDSQLLDNATGTNNYAAKGAHRLKISATLSKLAIGSTEDTNFVELMRVKNGIIQEQVRNTEYSVLGDNLARRTYDESGDYSTKSFSVELRETLDDGLNDGIYTSGTTTDDGNTASDDFLTAQISSGKAYVRGYEIEQVAPTFIDIPKPRSFENLNGGVTVQELGNFVKVNNVFSIPEVSPNIASNVTPYNTVNLHDTATSTRGTAAGTKIGVARARAIEHISGTDNTNFLSDTAGNSSEFRLYLFDVKMFTAITLDGTPSPAIAAGSKITGVTSGATGFAFAATSGTGLTLVSVNGTFSSGEKITSSNSSETSQIVENSGNTDLTISAIVTNNFSKAKQAHMAATGGSNVDFTADIKLADEVTLSGTYITETTGTNNLIGISGFDTGEVIVGDTLVIPVGDGTTEERIVDAVTSAAISFTAAPSTDVVTSANIVRKRAKLEEQTKNVLLRKLKKRRVKTLKTDTNSGVADTTITIRRQFTSTPNSSGIISLSAGANETFASATNANYTIANVKDGTGGSGDAGDIVDITGSNVSVGGAGTGTLTITSTTIFGTSGDFSAQVLATLTRTVSNEKSKTLKSSKQVKVLNGGATGHVYGTDATDNEISLGRADCFRLRAVYEAADASTDATAPALPIGTITGTFQRGETITGGTSGAKGILITTTDPLSYVLLTSTDFSASEEVTGATSGATATIDGAGVTAGASVVTSNYVLDDGQRDNFYDISRLVRKVGVPAPIGRLLVVFDFFEHGSGDFFSVDSYSGINYKDIPIYKATRVDPDTREPGGLFDLRDSIDFRPRVADIGGASGTVTATDTITGYSFDFASRAFSGTGSSTVDICQDGSNVVYDLDFHLGRKDSIFLNQKGEFKLIQGAPSENPTLPKTIDNAMKIADITLQPFVVNVTEDADFKKQINKRYTMRDIGRLEKRLQNVEYYTALSLLEQDTQSFEITDENGLNRFKSGFVVDNFSGHKVGNPLHEDYSISIDFENNELRPKYFMKGISLTEENTTDAERTSDGYQKTGDVITLPYSHVASITQPYATRTENVNPFLTFGFVGIVKLSPDGDEWFEVQQNPDIVLAINEGNFDTVVAQNENSIGTVWNAWETQWSGVTTTRQVTERETFQRLVNTTIVEEAGVRTRGGVNTQIVEQIDTEVINERVLSQSLIPFVRARTVTFTATGMKPNTRVYPFFDKRSVTAYVTPDGGSLGGNLTTDANGKVVGTFAIPNPTVAGNPRWRTGDLNFRLTSSSTNTVTAVDTVAQATYSAKGIFEVRERDIIGTRNARVEVTDVSQSVEVQRELARTSNITWIDPLAQSIISESGVGEFLTKIDIFFSTKDATIPITLQIREMDNGYPTRKVLPFGSITLNPSAVSVDATNASSATTFTFDSPVFLAPNTEYAICLISDSDNYNVWISRQGENDLGGRFISTQPYLGVLFKSQNNSTWSAFDAEDLKFTAYRASFTTTSNGTLTLNNDAVPTVTLPVNALETTNSSNVIKVNHPNHQMHSTSNNVTISGVVATAGSAVNGIPISEINATHTAIGNIGIDSYTITVSSNATSTNVGGGSAIVATENAQFETFKTILPVLEFPQTNLTSKIKSTSGTSPSGTETSFSKVSTGVTFQLNENFYFDVPKLIASSINETNEMSGSKSLSLDLVLSTTDEFLSPYIDLDKKTFVAVANRLDNIDSSSDVYPTSEYVAPTEPSGDSNEAIYITRKVQLESPATALRVILDAHRPSTSEIQVMFKLLRSDEDTNFDDIGFTYFNTDGSPDETANPNSTIDDFTEYVYSAGKKDDGTGTSLDEFIGFAIKIRMQGTNSALPPRIKDFRAIALAT